MAVVLLAAAASPAHAQLIPPLGPPPPGPPPPPPALPAPPVVEPGAPGPETTHVGGDATRRGAVSGGSLVPPLRARWRVSFASRVGRPVVGGGRVYVPFGGNVAALDLATGRELWRSATPGSLAYGSEKLVVSSYDRVTALDAASGASVWSAAGNSIDSPPLIAGDLAVVQGQGLYAFDLATGRQRWTGGTGDGTNGEPSASGDRIYEYGGCTLAAADRRTGGLLWSRNSGCSGGGGGRVVAHRDRAYIPPNSGRGYAVVRASDGSDVPGPSVDAVVGDVGVAVEDPLRGIDLATGRVLWSAKKATSGFGLFGRPLGVGDVLFRGRFAGDLEALAAADGKRRWEARLSAPRAISDGRFDENVQLAAGRDVLIVGRGGSIDALEAATATSGRIPVTIPRSRFAEVAERVTVKGRIRGALLPAVRLEVDEYPFNNRYAKAGTRARPNDKGCR